MYKLLFTVLSASMLLTSCIGDDIEMDETPEVVRILNRLDTIAVGESFQFDAMFTNNVGMEENRTIAWTSSDQSVLTIDGDGLATALTKGVTDITATVELDEGPAVMDQFTLVVDEETVVANTDKSGTIVTTSSYVLEGSFTMTEEDGKVIISVSDDYRASTALPGLYVYLSNNASTIGNAFEIQKVAVFNGAHTYEVEGVGINDYKFLLYWCAPFNVKVGEGVIE